MIKTLKLCLYSFGFNDSSYFLSTCVLGKEPACSAEDPGSTPGLGTSAEEGIGYPL